MKKLSVVLLASVALTMSAQHKIDFAGRQVIDDYRLELESNVGNVGPRTLASRAGAQTYNVIVELNDADFDLSNEVSEVVTQFSNFAVVSVTAAQMERLAAFDEVSRVSLGFENKPMMKAGRAATFVNDVHTGAGDLGGTKYTGKGVLAGLFDTGLDVNHKNFKTTDGQVRTKGLWVYSGNSSKGNAYTDPVSISNYTTENQNETHGTHVLGIMAGGYKGPAEYMEMGSNGRPARVLQTASNSAIPYYGVATEADLGVACGDLYDAAILSGVQNIVNYAKSHNQPCVVNLSIGNNIGPHDGSDVFSKGIDELGKYAIIFISSGNEGRDNISICADGRKIKTFIASNTSNASRANGYFDLWGSDNQIYTVRLFAYNRSTGREEFSYTLDTNLAGKSVKQSDMNGFGASKFSGTITLSSNIDPGNNRYNVNATVNLTGSTTQMLFGIEITPKDGQSVDGFTRNLVYTSQSQPGYTDGSPENSVNGMACGSNIICVGSFCTAKSFPVLSGVALGYQGSSEVDYISNFSSYGRVAGGRNLPDVCAPGEVVISSISEYYVRAKSQGDSDLSAVYTDDSIGLFSRNSSWQAMQGTSMASPFAAGIVATWLEADPSLKVEDVREILYETSTRDLLINSEIEKWGAGKINAFAGIKEVLKRKAGVIDVATDIEDAIVTSADGRNFEIFVAGAKRLDATLYSLAGTAVAKANGENTANLSATNVQPGVYVLSIATDKKNETRKIAVK